MSVASHLHFTSYKLNQIVWTSTFAFWTTKISMMVVGRTSGLQNVSLTLTVGRRYPVYVLPPLYYQCSSRDTEHLLVLSSVRVVHCLPQPTNNRHKWTSIPASHSGAALGTRLNCVFLQTVPSVQMQCDSTMK